MTEPPKTVVRPYSPGDARALLTLFRDTIRRVNARDYSPFQIAAWSSDSIDPDDWAARFAGRYVVVAELARRAVGFGELESSGHIDRFFVAADHQGRGIGRMLMSTIENEARRQGLDRLDLDASITARTFFERQGFRVVKPQMATCRGVELANFHMEKPLALHDATKAPARKAQRKHRLINESDARS